MSLNKSFTVKFFFNFIWLLKKRLSRATAKREDKVNKERELRLFFETLENKPQLIDTWDENLWITLVEKIEVSQDKACTVFFKNGISVKVDI